MEAELVRNRWVTYFPHFRGRRKERFVAHPRRRLIFSSLFLGLCVSAMALLHVWVRLQVIHMGYVLSTASKLHSYLEQENRELKLELATLTSPERLQQMAKNRLGMVEPEKDQVIVLP
jgi:cell division protein FtsL